MFNNKQYIYDMFLNSIKNNYNKQIEYNYFLEDITGDSYVDPVMTSFKGTSKFDKIILSGDFFEFPTFKMTKFLNVKDFQKSIINIIDQYFIAKNEVLKTCNKDEINHLFTDDILENHQGGLPYDTYVKYVELYLKYIEQYRDSVVLALNTIIKINIAGRKVANGNLKIKVTEDKSKKYQTFKIECKNI
jgi:hypothetical protein